MTLDFLTMKTVSTASLKAKKEMEKSLEQQKAQANEQVHMQHCGKRILLEACCASHLKHGCCKPG